MAFGKTASNYSTSDQSTISSELKRRLQAALSVTVSPLDQYCLIGGGTKLYSYYDTNSPVSATVDSTQPLPILQQSANGFIKVQYGSGQYWIPDQSRQCLTQAMVNQALAAPAKTAVDNWFKSVNPTPYQAKIYLENQAAFNAVVNQIDGQFLSPVLKQTPFFIKWRLV
jgi:hypothetical protein